MPAHFRIVETPTSQNEDKEPTDHARFSANGTVNIYDLMEEITYGTSFTESDIEGLLSLLKNVLYRQLSKGYNLKADGIGTFSLAVQCPPQTDKKKITCHNVEFRNIKYRPARELINKLSGMTFYLRSKNKSKSGPFEERKKFILNYLNTNFFITGKSYQEQLNVSKTTAMRDMKIFKEEGFIIREGKGPTNFYRLNT